MGMVANKSDAASRSRRRDRSSFLMPPSQIGLMLGYCRMKEEEIREGVRRLAEIL
jgi:DNA-binding transcriptional MocR family regulator